MSEIARKEKLRYRIFPWFVREGAVVDAVTVAADAKPDVDPTDNFPSLGCVTEGEPEITYRDLGQVELQCAQGFENSIPREIEDYFWIIRMEDSNELVRQLMYGLANQPGDGTAQTPAAYNHENRIKGWFKGSILRPDNTLMDSFDMWCEVSMDEMPASGSTIARPQLRFRRLYSELNTHVPVS